MLTAITVARPYARAIYDISEKLKNEAEWLAILENISVIAASKEVIKLLQDPKVSKAERASIFITLAKIKQPELIAFLNILATKNRLLILPQINFLFKEIYNKKHKEIEVELQTAYEVNDSFITKITNCMHKAYKSKISINASVDKKLIGGGVLRFEGKVIDASIATKIQRLAEAMAT